jgi:carboxyl-terminal processing protease
VSKYDEPSWYEGPVPHRPQQGGQRGQPANPQQQQGVYDPSPSFVMPEDDTQQPSYQVDEYSPQQEPSRWQKMLSRIAGLIVLVAIAFLAGWFSHVYFGGNSFTQNKDAKAYQNLILQAWSTIDQNYVDRKDVDYKKMAYAAIDGMTQSLNDKGHTRFMTPQDVQAQKQSLSGKFTGIGIYLHQDKDTKKLVITAPIPDSPAEKAGLKAGDVITAVDGVSTEGKDVNGVSSLIQGKEGTQVSITVQRPGVEKPLTFTMTRAVIQAPTVVMHYIPESHTAHIQVVQFASGVSDQLKTAITKAKSQGATNIVLDLRDNPGGLLREAQQMASLFLPEGTTVLIEQDSKGNKDVVKTTGTPLDTKIPLVVLVNGNSASAAEIVSGALQDNQRATIIGTKTFGTGTVLQQFDLDDGSALLLGVQEWLTPKGKFIRDEKISPDQTVELGANAIQISPTIENAQNMTLQQILSGSDTQLIKAIQFLKGQK